MEIKNLLHDEVSKEIEELGKMKLGDTEYINTVKGVTELTDRYVSIKKIEMEMDDKYMDREIDSNIKLTQIRDDKKDRRMKNLISIGGTLLMAGITVWGALKSWEFERDDTVASTMGKGFMSRLLPKK